MANGNDENVFSVMEFEMLSQIIDPLYEAIQEIAEEAEQYSCSLNLQTHRNDSK